MITIFFQIPKYYYVLATLLDLEKEHPGQSHRAASKEGTPENLFLAGQAFYIISQLLITKMLHINELDPIRRYLPSFNRPRRTDRYSAFQVGSKQKFLKRYIHQSTGNNLQFVQYLSLVIISRRANGNVYFLILREKRAPIWSFKWC